MAGKTYGKIFQQIIIYHQINDQQLEFIGLNKSD